MTKTAFANHSGCTGNAYEIDAVVGEQHSVAGLDVVSKHVPNLTISHTFPGCGLPEVLCRIVNRADVWFRLEQPVVPWLFPNSIQLVISSTTGSH